MQDDIGDKIIGVMQSDNRRDYTIPEIMTSLQVRNRERVAVAVARLEGSNQIEISRQKGRTKYYRLK